MGGRCGSSLLLEVIITLFSVEEEVEVGRDRKDQQKGALF